MFQKIFSRGKILCCQFYCVVYWSMNGWENFILGEGSFSIANLFVWKIHDVIDLQIKKKLLNYVVSLFGNKNVLEEWILGLFLLYSYFSLATDRLWEKLVVVEESFSVAKFYYVVHVKVHSKSSKMKFLLWQDVVV